MKTQYNPEVSVTLSPFYVSKANERSGFFNYNEGGESNVSHLGFYCDWFALRQFRFIPYFNEHERNYWDILHAWDQLIINKALKETGRGHVKIEDYCYKIPFESVDSRAWHGIFRKPAPTPVSTFGNADPLYFAMLSDGIINE